MGAFNAATLLPFMVGATAATNEPYLLQRGPYSMPRGQSVKNRKASKPNKTKRRQAQKARRRNR